MNVVARFPRTLAVLFSLLMVGPLVPPADAQDHVTKILPSLPQLGQVKPGDNCLQLGDVEASVLAAANTIQNEGLGYFAYDKNVPAICTTNGQPLQQWRDLVLEANGVLDAYRQNAAFIQNQYDSRLEYTLPSGPCQQSDNLTRPPDDPLDPSNTKAGQLDQGLHCGITRPQFVVLDDQFNGRRVGGFGDWTAITNRGASTDFKPVTRDTINGTETSWRFGDDNGYTRGAHEFLVSPELDLTPVRGEYFLVQQLVSDYGTAQNLLGSICGGGTGSPIAALIHTADRVVCLNGGAAVIAAYQRAIDSYTQDLPIMHEAATLDITYRANLQAEADGVRPWLYVGDHAPSRAELFDARTFGVSATDPGCLSSSAYNVIAGSGNPSVGSNECFARPSAGYHMILQPENPSGPGTVRPEYASVAPHTSSFRDQDRVHVVDPNHLDYSDRALGGDHLQPVTLHVDLTGYIGQRVWLVLEVATTPDTGRGDDPFHDPNVFPRQDAFGFDLVKVHAQGDAWPRELRVKDAAQTYQPVPAHDTWQDDATLIRTTNPPGNDPVVVRVQNAGEYYENATLTLKFQEQAYGSDNKSAGPFHDFGDPVDYHLVNVKPSEVRELRVAWPSNLSEGFLYKVNASLALDKGSVVPNVTIQGDIAKNATDPNATAARPPNMAEQGVGGATFAQGIVRAFTDHHLTAVHAPTSTVGAIMEVCSSVTDLVCAPQYTANKGERRILHVGVRNDGSSPEDIDAVLTFQLDGIERTSAVIDPHEQVLADVAPGETRAVDWAIAPADAGIYEATVTFMPKNALVGGVSLTRLVYVERSTGIICFDNVGDDRECAPSFQRDVPEAFHGEDLTAVAAASDGTLFATTAIGPDAGALFARSAASGAWSKLNDTTMNGLADLLGATPRGDLGFANVTTMLPAADGTLYLAGVNGTALARNGTTGALTMLPWTFDAGGGPLTIGVGQQAAGEVPEIGGPVRSDIALVGTAYGGVAPYAFAWRVLSSPPGGVGVIADATSGHTTFRTLTEGTYVLNLNVTDQAGASVNSNVTVAVGPQLGACVSNGGLVTAYDASQPAGPYRGAAQARCLRFAQDDGNVPSGLGVGVNGDMHFYVDLASAADFVPDATMDYVITFAATGGSPHSIDVQVVNGNVLSTTLDTNGNVACILTPSSASFQQPGNGDPNTLEVVVCRNWLANEETIVDSGTKYSATLTVLANGTTVDNVVAGGPGTFDFATYPMTSPPAVGTVTSVDPPAPKRGDAHALVISWDAPAGAVDHYVIERSIDPTTNDWAVIATQTDTTPFTDEGLESYHTYGYRITAVDAHGDTSRTPSKTVTGHPVAPHPDFTASAWWNGTLWLASTNGAVWHLNQTSGALENDTLTLPGTSAAYNGDLHALLATDSGLYAAGEFGRVFRHDGQRWAAVDAPVRDGTILALAQHDGLVFAVGAGGLVERSVSATKLENVTAAPCASDCDWAIALETNTQQLYLATRAGTFATCDACAMDDPAWSSPEVPVPTFLNGAGHAVRSLLVSTTSAGGKTVIALTGGATLEFAKRSIYQNAGDWTVASPIAPKDDGIIQRFSTPGGGSSLGTTWRWGVNTTDLSGTNDPSTDWTQLRVTIRHALIMLRNGSETAEVRVYYAPYPQITTNQNQVGPTCQSTVHDTGSTGSNSNVPPVKTGVVNGVCNNTLLMTYVPIHLPTATDTWENRTFEFSVPSASATSGTNVPVPAHFDSIEFYADQGVTWTIDSFDVESKSTSHDWEPVVYYHGSGPNGVKGVRVLACPDVSLTDSECSTGGTLSYQNGAKWWDSVSDKKALVPLGFQPRGDPWHVTAALADRPVWVFNDEKTSGLNARLTNNWNARLVSPILDLGEAYDPVVTFRQAYAFRVKTDPGAHTGKTTILPEDGGWVEVQYEEHGSECGADADVNATCWSPFQKVYPDRDGVPEYPRPGDIGYLSDSFYLDSADQQQDAYGYGDGINTTVPNQNHVPSLWTSLSYWGRQTTMLPDDTGVITGAHDTSAYQPVTIHLSDPANVLHDASGNAVSLSGRHVRVAFHVWTAHDGSNTAPADDTPDGNGNHPQVNNKDTTTHPSFPREGWYVTDLKVKGASKLGVDLAATNMTFRVGYDVSRIGPGPGTRVPINVTVENHGIFDVAGYTGELAIRRVTDAANGRTEPLATLTLSQQPLLAAGDAVNHTFYWDVPTTEGAQYVLSFTVKPIGIPRDEDPTDNVAALGSITAPILAATHREYHVEFTVNPENATTDITRYVPVFVNNTGNVPLSGFTVTRVISVLRGSVEDLAPNTTRWPTERAVPAGTRVNVQSISDEFDPSTDLFWKATERSDYKFRVDATAPGLPPSTMEKTIKSFATYFFDDADTGPRGESLKGDWQFDDAWGPQAPGFRSDLSYGFGDAVLLRYPNNADASAVTPLIDLSGARSARFGFYTKFLFPDSFDAGVVEASADGGRTWHRLTPRSYVDDNGTTWPGYPAPIAASSPLHLTHNPDDKTSAFTGDSATLPGNVGGWVYREFDLTQFANVTERSLPYVAYDSAALANYRGSGAKDTTHPTSTTTPNAYFDSTWNTGPLDKFQYWEAQNLTESAIRSPSGNPTVWWSGSAAMADDHTRPIRNQWLDISLWAAWYEVERNPDGTLHLDADGHAIPLDAPQSAGGRRVYLYDAQGHLCAMQGTQCVPPAWPPVPQTDNGIPRSPALRVGPDDKVVVDWWEWYDRYGLSLGPVPGTEAGSHGNDINAVASAVQYSDGTVVSNIRFNFTIPSIIGQQGKWLHMQSDISGFMPGNKDGLTVNDLAFIYAPISHDAPTTTKKYDDYYAYDDKRVQSSRLDDRGFAVDGFTVRAYKIVNGAPADQRDLLSTADAWNASTVQVCDDQWSTGDDLRYGTGDSGLNAPNSGLPCWRAAAGSEDSPSVMHHRTALDVARTLVNLTGYPLGSRVTVTGASADTITDTAVDFVASGVRVGDVVNVTTGAGAGLRAPVVAVDVNTLTLGAPYWDSATPFDGTTSVIEVKPTDGNAGSSWALVPQLPSIPMSWNVTNVRVPSETYVPGPNGDQFNGNYSQDAPLPTGEVPRAWYSGPVCRDDVSINNGQKWTLSADSPDQQTLTVSGDISSISIGDKLTFASGTGEGAIAFVQDEPATGQLLVQKLAFEPKSGDQFTAQHLQQSCLRPGDDTRLVTPMVDLSRVAGDDAQLAFWHEYAFKDKNTLGGTLDPFASGGTVEVQAFDPVTGWGPWQQIYARPDVISIPDTQTFSVVDRTAVDLTRAMDGETLGIRGGYSAYTVNVTRSSIGSPRFDPDVQAVKHTKLDGRVEDVQYLYSSESSQITKDSQNAWVPAHFDLSPFLGKQIRIGFHVTVAGDTRSNMFHGSGATGEYSTQDADFDYNNSDVMDPYGAPTQTTDKTYQHQHLTGWWISNVSIVGTVIEGAPVKLRLRAVTDGNVNNGAWQVDDAGLFGSRYARNVGIFVDQTPGAFGAFANNTTTVPVTLRNLGETVRRDLAIEVRRVGGTMTPTLAGDDSRSWVIDQTDPSHPVLRVSGFNLAPGQSVTIPVYVHVPASLSDNIVSARLHITLKEYSAPDDKYVNVTDNEVQGFLQRDIKVIGERGADITITNATVLPAGALAGELVEVRADATNTGYGPVDVSLTCSAITVVAWKPIDRRQEPQKELDSSKDVSCGGDGNATIGPHATRAFTFHARPDSAGIMLATIGGNATVGGDTANLTSVTISAAIGRSPVVFHEGFDPGPRPANAGDKDTPPDATVKQNWQNTKPDAPYSGQGEPLFEWPRGHDAPGALLLGVPDSRYQNGKGESYSDVQCTPHCEAVSPEIDLHNYTTEHLVLSFWHLPRFAKGDGGRVSANVLLNEPKHNVQGVNAWSGECVLQPIGGYQGQLLEFSQGGNPPVTDQNGAPGADNGPLGPGPDGYFNGSSDAWRLATFDLSQTCKLDDGSKLSLLGHTIRVNFQVFAGPKKTGLYTRGAGQGWFIDDVTVSPQSITIAPATQSAVLLDNTTKLFNILVRNAGSSPDIVHLRLDEGNSSVPPGSIQLPPDVSLAPGESRIVQAQVTLPRDPSLLPTTYRARVLLNSLMDGSARGLTDLVIEFAPRALAELQLTADAPGGIVQEGTSVIIPATVENDGITDSVASSVTLVDHYVTSDGVAHDDDYHANANYKLDLVSLPSYFQNPDRATSVLAFQWAPPRGSAGPHTLTITADPDKLGEEYTRINNVVVMQVNVSELLIPDLDISAPTALVIKDASGAPVTAQRDADVTRYEVTAGELASFDVTLRNAGKAGATNVDLRAFIGTLSLPPKVIPYVPPGAQMTIRFNWLAQKGEYPISIIARTEQVEVSTANDRNPAKGVTILTVKGYEVKTTIADVPLDIVPPLDVKVPFNISNSGNAGEDLVLKTTLPQGWTVTLPRASLYLRAGETYSAVANVHVPDGAVAGQQFMSIAAVARENPMKVAAASSPLHVHAFYGGSVDASQLARGAPAGLAIPLKLTNEGNSLEPWALTVRLPAGWTSQETMPAKVVVPPHGSTTFVLHAVAPDTTAPGDRQLIVKAQLPNGDVRDAVVTVRVEALRAAIARVAEGQPKETLGALAYPVTIENDGNVDQPFDVLLLGEPAGVTAQLQPSHFTVPPGGRTLATLVVKPTASVDAGQYDITGYAAFSGVHPDTAEGKANVQTLRVTLIRPDLRVAGTLDYAPHTDVRAGERVVVKATVSNRGQGTVTDLPVHLFVDDVFVAETRVPTLAAGATRDVSLNWTALPGKHTLTAVLDPWNDTVDANREDNAVSTAITVQTAGVSGLVGGSRVPAPSLAWILLAAAAAAVVLARSRAWRPPR